MTERIITTGMSSITKKEVGANDTDSSFSSPLDFLLSTTAIVAMLIEASVKMLDSTLDGDLITVGKHLDLYHLKPTLVGEKIELILTVKKVEKDSISMDFLICDSIGAICSGTYERVIVNKNQLIDIAYARSEAKE